MLSNNYETFQMWTQLLASNESYTIAQSNPNPVSAPAGAKGDRLAQARKAS